MSVDSRLIGRSRKINLEMMPMPELVEQVSYTVNSDIPGKFLAVNGLNLYLKPQQLVAILKHSYLRINLFIVIFYSILLVLIQLIRMLISNKQYEFSQILFSSFMDLLASVDVSSLQIISMDICYS